jgi:hypothetical protein
LKHRWVGFLRVGVVPWPQLMRSKCAEALYLLDFIVLKSVLAGVLVDGLIVFPDASLLPPVFLHCSVIRPWLIVFVGDLGGAFAVDVGDGRVISYVGPVLVSVKGAVVAVCVVGRA